MFVAVLLLYMTTEVTPTDVRVWFGWVPTYRRIVLIGAVRRVEVVTFRPVFILGEVVKPGQYPYEPGMTALTTVAIAGGFTYRAQTGYVSILRTINGHSFEGRAMRGTPLQPGDVVTVFERYF